jgi:hypothetical protein
MNVGDLQGRIAVWKPELDSRRDDPGSGSVELQPELLYRCGNHLGREVDREPMHDEAC